MNGLKRFGRGQSSRLLLAFVVLVAFLFSVTWQNPTQAMAPYGSRVCIIFVGACDNPGVFVRKIAAPNPKDGSLQFERGDQVVYYIELANQANHALTQNITITDAYPDALNYTPNVNYSPSPVPSNQPTPPIAYSLTTNKLLAFIGNQSSGLTAAGLAALTGWQPIDNNCAEQIKKNPNSTGCYLWNIAGHTLTLQNLVPALNNGSNQSLYLRITMSVGSGGA